MNDSALVKLCRNLTKSDIRTLRKVVRSPFFNHREDVIRLFDFLADRLSEGSAAVSRERIFKAVFPEKEAFDMVALRHVASFLLDVIRQWLAIDEMRADGSKEKIYTQLAYKRRGCDDLRERELPDSLANHEGSAMRDTRFHRQHFQLRMEAHDIHSKQNRAGEMELSPLVDSMAASQLATLFRVACIARSYQNFTGKPLEVPLLQAALDLMERGYLADVPAVLAWFHTFRCLESTENAANFQQLKALLPGMNGQFRAAELGDLYISAINFCIRNANQGRADFFEEAFQLYEAGFESGALLPDQRVSKYTFKNAAFLGLHLGKYEWVSRFLDRYRPFLPVGERENLAHLVRAKAEFQQKNYDAALLHLQEVALSEEALYNLDARRMLVRIFYEQAAWSALESQLESYTAYIRRHKEVGYHRENHLCFISWIRKMMRSDLRNQAVRRQLREKISLEKSVLEKTWLLEQLA